MSTSPLSPGEQAILVALASKPLELHWGRNGWVPERLPKPARRGDFDSLRERRELVKIELGQLIALPSTNIETSQ